MKALVSIIALSLLPPPVLDTIQVNRTNPSEISELEWHVRFVVEQGERGECGNLVELFNSRGFYRLREEALLLIRENMPLLEDCIVESQRSPDRIDRTLHREFRRHASPRAIAAMRSILRKQIVVPPELTRLENAEVYASRDARRAGEIATRRFLKTVEILADYQDPQDVEFLTALYDTLCHVPAESLWSRYTEPPSWFVHMALRRFGDPAAGAVLLPNSEGKWDFVREHSEITSIGLYSFSVHDLDWHPLALPVEKAAEILIRLASSPLKERGEGMITEDHTATLRIRFGDGVAAKATACSQGWVRYEDNRRASDSGFMVENEELANEILNLVTLVEPVEDPDVH